jgi:ABC-2 type transport system ATP-binding protein
MLELPRQAFTPAARALKLSVIEAAERVEISTHDVEGTLRQLLQAQVPLAQLRIRPANLEDLFLELTGKELRP